MSIYLSVDGLEITVVYLRKFRSFLVRSSVKEDEKLFRLSKEKNNDDDEETLLILYTR